MLQITSLTPYDVISDYYLSQNIAQNQFLCRAQFTRQTRLLGRPQPQMYPPVTLNQYTWVNITHKHIILYRVSINSMIHYHNAILQTGIQVPTARYILHLKINMSYFKFHNLIFYILKLHFPQFIHQSPTSHIVFPSPTSHICLPPISHLPHFFTPNLPPPTSCVTPLH